jgi:hypothetical protein
MQAQKELDTTGQHARHIQRRTFFDSLLSAARLMTSPSTCHSGRISTLLVYVCRG